MTPPRRSRPTLARAVAWALLAGTVGLAAIGFLRIAPALLAGPQSYDFAAYYVAARVVSLGLPLYDEAAMRQAAATTAGALPHPRYIYPPFFAWLLQPLGALPFGAARAAWLFINIAALAAAVAALGRRFGLGRWAPALFLLLWLMPPVYDTLLLGQVSIVLMCLVAVAVSASADEPRPAPDLLAGVCLGLAAGVKLYPALILAPYLLARRMRVIAAAGATAAATLAIGVAACGLDDTIAYVTHVLPSVGGISPLPVSQSVWSVSLRLFTPTSFQYAFLSTDNLVARSLQPVVDLPLLATLAPLAVLLSMWGATLRLGWPRGPGGQPHAPLTGQLAAAIIATLATSPVTHDHYLVLLLIPGLYLWRERQGAAQRERDALATGLLAAALLVVLQRYWRVLLDIAPSPLVTCWGFLAMLALWAAVVWHIRRRGSPAALS